MFRLMTLIVDAKIDIKGCFFMKFVEDDLSKVKFRPKLTFFNLFDKVEQAHVRYINN